MTRAKRYANHAGGRKYSKTSGKELVKNSTHKDAGDKLEASNVFRETWNRCRNHEGYLKRKKAFQKEQKLWDEEQKAVTSAKDRRPTEQECPKTKPG